MHINYMDHTHMLNICIQIAFLCSAFVYEVYVYAQHAHTSKRFAYTPTLLHKKTQKNLEIVKIPQTSVIPFHGSMLKQEQVFI